MHTFLTTLVACSILTSILPAQETSKTKQADAPIPKIQFTELGINLYGKFRFESEGELFDIIDNDSKILISAGAVLTCIRQSYTVGYFGGGATITEGGASRVIPKAFFILKPSGKISFHSPTPDGNFPGKQLPDSIEFGRLYDPQKNQGEQDGGGQPAPRPESK
jgi:hypothetical protein